MEKKRGGILKYVVIGVVVLGIIGAFASSGGSNKTETTNPSQIENSSTTAAITKSEVQYIQITSTELIDSWDDNSVKCKQLYDGKLLEVTGKVSSVGEDILKKTYVSLGHDNKYTLVGIQCFANDDETKNKIADLKEGDVITVQGEGSAGSLSFSINKAKIK